jgi:hypothetical protein
VDTSLISSVPERTQPVVDGDFKAGHMLDIEPKLALLLMFAFHKKPSV